LRFQAVHLFLAGVVVGQLHQAAGTAQVDGQAVAGLVGATTVAGYRKVIRRRNIPEIQHPVDPGVTTPPTLIHGTIPLCALTRPIW
jgi:hypothetical protein